MNEKADHKPIVTVLVGFFKHILMQQKKYSKQIWVILHKLGEGYGSRRTGAVSATELSGRVSFMFAR